VRVERLHDLCVPELRLSVGVAERVTKRDLCPGPKS